ncbi:hypothetical protein CRG98_000553 [Punica granatum]|uniref:Transposase MuDR plant domain-containing protein n=1 Tax=Punica granatum TaxID=22663 RepID=A0A2I0LEG6_PUNGR|nr:hypothetical protein CRG98_000553 [Punica granatum]
MGNNISLITSSYTRAKLLIWFFPTREGSKVYDEIRLYFVHPVIRDPEVVTEEELLRHQARHVEVIQIDELSKREEGGEPVESNDDHDDYDSTVDSGYKPSPSNSKDDSKGEDVPEDISDDEEQNNNNNEHIAEDMQHDKEQFARGSTEVEVEPDDDGIPVRPTITADLAGIISSDEDEAYHSNELHDRCVSDDDKSEEENTTYPQFDENAQSGEVQSQLTMLFPNLSTFKRAVTYYNVHLGRAFKFTKNDSHRVRAKCTTEGCKWEIFCS